LREISKLIIVLLVALEEKRGTRIEGTRERRGRDLKGRKCLTRGSFVPPLRADRMVHEKH